VSPEYSEKQLENIIKTYPKDFLGEELIFLEQQPHMGGWIPYLLFKDKSGVPVIVELQLGEFDRDLLC